MTTKNEPRTAKATAALVRKTDETRHAARLRSHGWLVVPPEDVASWRRTDSARVPTPTAGEHR